MLIGYHPMYPKLIGRMVKIMGPKGLALYAKDTGITIEALQAFQQTGDIGPIAEHIPVMWSKLFADATPLQAAALVDEAEKS